MIWYLQSTIYSELNKRRSNLYLRMPLMLKQNNLEDGYLAVLSFEELSLSIKSDINNVTELIETYNKSYTYSNEVLTENSVLLWTRTETSLKKSLENLKKYHEVINAGVHRLSEELAMLGRVADDIKAKKPFKTELKIKNPNRFTINGKFEPHNVRPLLSEFQNLLDFGDKILNRFGEVTFDLLNNVTFDDKFLDGYNVDLTAFKAKNWLRGLETVDSNHDKRFKEKQTVYKGQTFNSNRAIYYVGPADDMSGDFESNRHKWALTQKTLASLRFKCLNDKSVKLIEQKNLEFKTSNLTNIKQRCNILSGMLKRLLARRREINRLLDNIQKIYTACSDIKTKAERVEALKFDSDNEQSNARPFPSENKVFIESLVLYRNAIRITFDYYNVISIFLRILGSQAYLCDLELKAYSEPVVNPVNQRENQT